MTLWITEEAFTFEHAENARAQHQCDDTPSLRLGHLESWPMPSDFTLGDYDVDYPERPKASSAARAANARKGYAAGLGRRVSKEWPWRR